MGGIDAEIGRRIRTLRQTRGLTMEQVADQLGVSHQQIQKYETGYNRVSAARLFELAQVFDVPISAFFEGLQLAADQAAQDATSVDSRSYKLAYEFDKLSEPQKRAVLSLVQSMSDKSDTSGHQDGS